MRLRLEFMKRFMIFPTSILSIRLRRYPRKIQKPTQKTNSYVSDVRYISSSVKIYKGMSFYLRILSFCLWDYRVLFGLLLEFTIRSVQYPQDTFLDDQELGNCGRYVDGRFLWESVDGISWTRSCLAKNYSLFQCFWDNKRDEKGLLGMKGSYITTPRYLMHSVKGQE